MKEINKILLRRKNKIIITEKTSYIQSKTEQALVLSMIKNFEALGFSVSADLFARMRLLSSTELKQFYKVIIPCLKEMVGADKTYRPMYPNFPQQVMDATDVELLVNALVHYYTFGNLMPEYEKDERLPLIDDNKMAILSIGTYDDVMEIFTNLVASKTSLSTQDKVDVETIMLDCMNYYDFLPDEIPLKENVAFISKLIVEKASIVSAKYIQKYFKTATDVLRLVVALSDEDISLAKQTKCRSLRRKERRLIMDLLSGCGDITEDLFRHRKMWLYVARFLHPFEQTYRQKYGNVVNAFDVLHNRRKPLMFAGKVQNAIIANDMREAATLLKHRPGDFARQLDKVLRDATDKNYVVNCFKDIANEVSTPVLLQVYQHFVGRASTKKNPVRVCFPKGNLAKALVISNDLPDIDIKFCKAIQRICKDALINNYMSKDFMGNVYIDSELKNFLVPFSQRSASKTTKTIVRGSKVPVKKEASAVRAFIWWTNMDESKTDDYYGNDRVDIDLSAAIFDENWNYLEHVSYTNLRSSRYKAYHSGDITNGGSVNGNGVAEFLDVDIASIAKQGRYIVYQVYNFTNQKFCDLTNCRFGWMEREDVNSGEIFEPTTVAMSMDVTAESTVAIPVIFDCKERKFIWCDMNLSINRANCLYGGNNLESNLKGVKATCYGMTNLNKANLFDLISFNASARGNIVTNRNDADIIFSNDTTAPYETVDAVDEKTGRVVSITKDKTDVPIVTAFNIDYFMGQLL